MSNNLKKQDGFESKREKQLVKIIDFSREFLNSINKEIDYQKIADDMLEISGAKYVGFNVQKEDGGEFITVGLSGLQSHLEKSAELLGFNPKGKVWKHDPIKEMKTPNNITFFDSLHELTGRVIPKQVIQLIEKLFDIGQVVVVKILVENKSIGDFTLIMGQNETLNNSEIVELYASQVGLFIEKTRNEKALFEAKRRLENILDGTNAGTWEWNVQTGETRFNSRWAEIIGYTLEEISPTGIETWLKFLHPEDMKKSEEKLKLVFERKEPFYSIECRMKHKEGHWVWIFDKGKVLTWTEDRKPLWMFGTHIDISDLIQKETLLSEKTNLLDAVFNSIREGIAVVNSDYTLEYMNDTLRRWKNSSGLLEEKRCYKVLFGKEKICQSCPAKECLATGEPHHKEFLLNTSEGEKNIDIYTYPLVDSQNAGRIKGVVEFIRDITESKQLQRMLSDSEEQNRLLVAQMQQGLVVYEIISDNNGNPVDFKFIRVNREFEEQTGLLGIEVVGKTLSRVIPNQDKHWVDACMKVAFDGKPCQFEFYQKDQDKWFRASAYSPKEMQVAVITNDITENKNMAESLFIEKETFRTTLLSVGDGVISTDNRGRITIMNQIAQSLTGWTQQEARGKPLEKKFNIVDEYSRETSEGLGKEVIQTGKVFKHQNTLLISKTGKETSIEGSVAPVRDIKGKTTGVVAVFRDITEKKEKQKQVEYLSFHDYLTGVYNRRYMEDAVRRLDTPRNFPFTIMVLDVNGLKLTNDAFGHQMGDRLLKAVAMILIEVCRADDIICRIGGDEFVILLPKTDAKQADSVKKRIVSATMATKLDSVIVSLAIGYAVKTRLDQDIEEIQKIADNNMYEDKIKFGKTMRSKTIEIVLININKKYDKEKIHTERVSQYCERIARAMELDEKEIENAKVCGVLHDIGKIMVPEEILNKSGDLTQDEWEEIKRHPVTSYHILKGVDEYAALAKAVLHHHERMDGTGYPEQLKGKEIPLLSRVIAVADAYEAMTSSRNYQVTKSKEEAIRELEEGAGSQFDPEIVKVFIEKVI